MAKVTYLHPKKDQSLIDHANSKNDHLIFLDDFFHHPISYLAEMTEENFNNFMNRVEMLREWGINARSLRERLIHSRERNPQ